MARANESCDSIIAQLVTRHDRMLHYGLVASILGLPAGIYLGLPAVWGLALVGIVIGGIKLAARRAAT